MISKMASIENKCFKLDRARSSIRLIQDHDFDISYKTWNRNPDSETQFGFRIKKCTPGIFCKEIV
jgi:hypothetical protein